MNNNDCFKSKKRLKTFSGILAFFVILLFIICMNFYLHYHAEVEILRESSPDNQYTIIINRIGYPGFKYDENLRIEMICKTNPNYHTSFNADIDFEGFPDTTGDTTYNIEWFAYGVQLTLHNSIQSDESYILPF